jgi:hypothetical protein
MEEGGRSRLRGVCAGVLEVAGNAKSRMVGRLPTGRRGRGGAFSAMDTAYKPSMDGVRERVRRGGGYRLTPSGWTWNPGSFLASASAAAAVRPASACSRSLASESRLREGGGGSGLSSLFGARSDFSRRVSSRAPDSTEGRRGRRIAGVSPVVEASRSTGSFTAVLELELGRSGALM